MTFDPSKHPRVPAGQPGGGQFTLSLNGVTQDSSGNSFPIGSRAEMEAKASAWNQQTTSMGYKLNSQNTYSVVPASGGVFERKSALERGGTKFAKRLDSVRQRLQEAMSNHVSRWSSSRRKGDHYTVRGIRRLKCIRCQIRTAVHEWSICSDGNVPRPLCDECDIAINKLVLEFMRHPDVGGAIARYRAQGGAR